MTGHFPAYPLFMGSGRPQGALERLKIQQADKRTYAEPGKRRAAPRCVNGSARDQVAMMQADTVLGILLKELNYDQHTE